MNGKFRGLREVINTKYLKEEQCYTADCGCQRKYETVEVRIIPDGNTFKIETTLFRNAGDMMWKAFQPIWDDKKIQKNLSKAFKNIETKKYVPTICRDLTKDDYRDLYLAYLILYKWMTENLVDDYPALERIRGAINVLEFAYDGKAEITNELHNNDINTVDPVHLDLNIAQLTMSKEEFKKFYDSFLDDKHAERDKMQRSVLKGLMCHRCNIPMVEIEDERFSFEGKGHILPGHLRGRTCQECHFTVYVPDDLKNYIGLNNEHYLMFGGTDILPASKKKKLTKEITDAIQQHKDKMKEFDTLGDKMMERREKVLNDIRESNKAGKESKYFGKMPTDKIENIKPVDIIEKMVRDKNWEDNQTGKLPKIELVEKAVELTKKELQTVTSKEKDKKRRGGEVKKDG
jgi:hypothetical protein